MLRARAEKALRETRLDDAVTWADHLVAVQPNEANKRLATAAHLAMARQRRLLEHWDAAAAQIRAACALGIPADTELRRSLTIELAHVGDVARALELAQQREGPEFVAVLLGHAADMAVRRGPAGRAALPEALHADYDRIASAFADQAAGRDDAARAALQGIGLSSRFLEWKLFLRGLLAYYQNDDARALENWQRLRPDRLPAALAAPLRFQVDADYRVALPPNEQRRLQGALDALQRSPLIQQLRSVQSLSAGTRTLVQALAKAPQLLPLLRTQAPNAVPRLAACFYWAIVNHGNFEDVADFTRHFGTPADDPTCSRLHALACERRGLPAEAHQFWQQFEKRLAQHPEAWPGTQAARVRALVWRHMGEIAERAEPPPTSDDTPPFLRMLTDFAKPLRPSAEACFKHSLELAPDQQVSYERLLSYYREHDQFGKAEKIARKLLQRFPEHAATLEALGDLRVEAEDFAEGLQWFEQAQERNPLERRLRFKRSTAHGHRAVQHAAARRFAEARADFQAALALAPQPHDPVLLCRWAATEWKAGETNRAEELMQQAVAAEGSALAVAYRMLVEAARLKLPVEVIRRMERAFLDGLQEPPTASAAVGLADTLSRLRLLDLSYTGSKGHEKKIMRYLERCRTVPFAEQQLEHLGASLGQLEAHKQLKVFGQLGQRQFPANPHFYYMEAEAYIGAGPTNCPIPKVKELLAKARELAAARPHDGGRDILLDAIQAREAMLNSLNGLFSSDILDVIFDSFHEE
jgi:tetratricopeptide (TPR) repeat protein